MIGIVVAPEEHPVAEEFFQLFKTPWEHYRPKGHYDVVLSTTCEVPDTECPQILFGSALGEARPLAQTEVLQADLGDGLEIEHQSAGSLWIYGRVACFPREQQTLATEMKSQATVGFKSLETDKIRIRFGYDLFEEVERLLTEGQPAERASCPTLDRHIAVVRHSILSMGCPLVEIPPVPPGYDFFACLTHDVDFIRVTQHRFDHTMWGFVYRGLVDSVRRTVRRGLSWTDVWTNWLAVLSLPLVHLGLRDDFWFNFQKYVECEAPFKSTFFILPFKDRVGDRMRGTNSYKRASRYDVDDIRETLGSLVKDGFEVGLHGIDAWHSAERGRIERDRIREVVGHTELGIRMHWLCFDAHSPAALDRSGFSYDSTIGFNETVGYRAGTSQVYRPLGCESLLEVPLHIQDVALFYPDFLDLSASDAWTLCSHLLDSAQAEGGVLTLLWHMRSLGPERLWGDFYRQLLQELTRRHALIATAGEIAGWFRARRAVKFIKTAASLDGLELEGPVSAPKPSFLLRLHYAEPRSGATAYRDIPWSGGKILTTIPTVR